MLKRLAPLNPGQRKGKASIGAIHQSSLNQALKHVFGSKIKRSMHIDA
jgi:hypothetical protein